MTTIIAVAIAFVGVSYQLSLLFFVGAEVSDIKSPMEGVYDLLKSRTKFINLGLKVIVIVLSPLILWGWFVCEVTYLLGRE